MHPSKETKRKSVSERNNVRSLHTISESTTLHTHNFYDLPILQRKISYYVAPYACEYTWSLCGKMCIWSREKQIKEKEKRENGRKKKKKSKSEFTQRMILPLCLFHAAFNPLTVCTYVLIPRADERKSIRNERNVEERTLNLFPSFLPPFF